MGWGEEQQEDGVRGVLHRRNGDDSDAAAAAAAFCLSLNQVGSCGRRLQVGTSSVERKLRRGRAEGLTGAGQQAGRWKQGQPREQEARLIGGAAGPPGDDCSSWSSVPVGCGWPMLNEVVVCVVPSMSLLPLADG